MAPELRKRKPVEAAKPAVAAPKAAAKASPKPKRKATEDASPVSMKKQKSSKKTAVEKKTPNKAAKKETKSKKKEEEEKKKKQDEEMAEAEEEEEEEEEEVEEPAADKDEEPEEDATELEADDDEKLQVLAVDLDPEDEEEANEAEAYKPGQDVGKIPKVSKEVQKAAEGKSHEGSGVIYLGRIPHGFYEHQMKQYLSQFGPILRLRLSRNKKTGASKHFAFVEFAEASTAEIVAKTMDNYLLFGHILKCKQVAKEQLHDDVWKGANRRFKKVPWNKMAGKKLEKPLTESAWANKVAKEKSSRAKKAAKLKAIGYEFEAPKIKAVPAPAAIENGDGETKAIEAAPEPEKAVEKKAEEAKKPAAVEQPEPEPEVAEEEKDPKAKKATKASAKAKGTKTTRAKKAKA